MNKALIGVLCLLPVMVEADVFNGTSSITIKMDDNQNDALVATIQHYNSNVDAGPEVWPLVYHIEGHGDIAILIEITPEVFPCFGTREGCTDRIKVVSWPDTLIVDEVSVETWENNSSYIRLYLNLVG